MTSVTFTDVAHKFPPTNLASLEFLQSFHQVFGLNQIKSSLGLRLAENISDGLNTILLNNEKTRILFFKHRTNSNLFIYWWSNSNILFLALNKRTSNLIGLSLDLLNYSSNWLEHHFFEHRMILNVFIYW